MTASPTPLEIRIDGAVATLTLNRPDAGNAMNQAMMEALRDAAHRCAGDPAVRAVVLTGAGEMFCAGGDVKFFHDAGREAAQKLDRLIGALHDAIRIMTRMDAPVITAVNGTAAGAGLSLALSGDLAIAVDSAKFCVAYTGVGLTPDGGSTYLLPRLIGLRRARELILSNRVIGADEAHTLGMIDAVVSPPDLEAAVQEATARLASGPTRAYGRIKRLLADTYSASLDGQLDAEGRAITASALTDDAQEGFAAFVGKRKPRFSGK